MKTLATTTTACAILLALSLAPCARAFALPASRRPVLVGVNNKLTTTTNSWKKLRAAPSSSASSSALFATANGDSNSNNNSQQLSASIHQALSDKSLAQAARALETIATTNDIPQLSREQWNELFDLIEERTSEADTEQTENMRMALEQNRVGEFPPTSQARTDMTRLYNALQGAQQLRLFGAVDPQLPLAAGPTHQVPPPLLEGILDLPMKALTPKPTASLLWAGVGLAVLEGLTSAAFGIPLNVLVLSTVFLFLSDKLFLNGAVFESLLKVVSPGVQEKIVRHEAGHFLAAYLLGCPVEGLVLSAWAALQDKRFGHRSVSAGTSFFDPQLSEQINQKRSVSRSAVDRYTIIVMAGIAAEADFYGRADGGAGDELSLVAFLSNLNGGNSNTWTPDTIRNQARWGALQAVLMLREYRPAYLALVDALERGATLGECVWAIEEAAKKHNLTPTRHPLGFLSEEEATSSSGTRLGVREKVVTWTKNPRHPTHGGSGGDDESEMEQSRSLVTTAATTATTMADAASTPLPSVQQPAAPAPMDTESMATSLQDYRAQVEAKLQAVEKEIQELESKGTTTTPSQKQ